MIDRLTDRARRVVLRAQRAAHETRWREVGALHLLFAVALEGTGVAASVLERLRVDAARLARRARARLPEGDGAVPVGPIPFGADAVAALDRARVEAERFGHGYAGTEHLLLALAGDETAGTGEILRRMGFDPGSAREEIRALLALDPEPRPPAPEAIARVAGAASLRDALDRVADLLVRARGEVRDAHRRLDDDAGEGGEDV